MNKKIGLLPLIILITLIPTLSVSAQGTGAVETSVTVAPGEYTVGDPIQLEIEIVHPTDSTVIFPELDKEWGEFIIYSQSAPETEVNSSGQKSTTQIIDVRLFAPGDFTTPELPVTIADSRGQLSETVIEPVSLSIASVLVQGDTELRDIKPQAEIPFFAALPWIIVAVVLSLVALTTVWLVRRRRAKIAFSGTDSRLPYEVALERLDRIEQLDLPREGRFKEHYTLISDCVRVYVERAFDIPIMERTTAEIQKSIKKTPISIPVARQFLMLLDESDLVKFSKFTPDAPTAEEALQRGRFIVMETMPSGELDPATGSTESTMRSMSDVTEPTHTANGNVRQTEVQA